MRTRNIQFKFRLNQKEAEEFERKVSKTGMKKETFIRHLISGYEPREKPDKEFFDAMRMMTSIGNRINQIAAKANALDFIDERAYKKDAQELLNLRLEIQEKFLMPQKS